MEFLPQKHEFIINVALSDIQKILFENYEIFKQNNKEMSSKKHMHKLFEDYNVYRKVLIYIHSFNFIHSAILSNCNLQFYPIVFGFIFNYNSFNRFGHILHLLLKQIHHQTQQSYRSMTFAQNSEILIAMTSPIVSIAINSKSC